MIKIKELEKLAEEITHWVVTENNSLEKVIKGHIGTNILQVTNRSMSPELNSYRVSLHNLLYGGLQAEFSYDHKRGESEESEVLGIFRLADRKAAHYADEDMQKEFINEEFYRFIE